MCKRAMLMLLALMTVPSFAGATTYWAITATTSPTALKSNLTAARPANFGNYTTPGGATAALTNVTKSTLSSVSFNVAAVAGYTVKVKVDGTQVATAPGTVTITKSSVLNRSIVATYTAASYVISTSPSTGGTITGSVTAPASTSPSVTIAALPGYTIAGAKIDGTVYAVADPLPAGVTKVGGVYTFNAVSAAHTIQGVFALIPAATAIISNGAATTVAPGTSFVLDGSSSVSNVAGTTYAWTTTCGTLTAVVPADQKKVNFTAPATTGNCTATLTLTAAGVSPDPADSIVISVASPNLVGICTDCHNGVDGPSSAAYLASQHVGQATCQQCHNPNNDLSHAYSKPAYPVCAACHASSPAVTAKVEYQNWTKSLHNQAVNHFEQIGCDSCHNAHSLVATATDGKTDSCGACHVDRRGQFPGAGNYSIYTSASMLVLKAPHGQGAPTYALGSNGAQDNAAAGWAAAQPQYLAQGAVCTDCHGHDNTINAGYAEGGHGKPSSDVMNAWTHYNWKARQNAFAAGVWGSRQNGNCNRCHTAYGFMKFANQTTGYTRLQLKLGVQGDASTANNVLICIGCHSSVEGALRTNAAPSGNNAAGKGAGQALSQGYFALFSSSVANLGAGNTKPQVQFPGYKNSSICIPCHSGRTTDVYVKNYIATIANYSTLQLSNYQHAANMGQTFIGKGGWDFGAGTLKNFTSAANQTPHTTIGMAGDQGPCVGCHYSEEAKTHSLEVNYTSATCTPCHGAAGPQLAKFAEFSSARFALDTLVRAKMATVWVRGTTDLNVERGGFFKYGAFGKAPGVPADRTTAQNAYGAVYNWQLLQVWDANAWAHNPAYARQILNDTLTYLNSNGTDTVSTPAKVAAAISAANAIKAVDQAKANAFANGNADPNALCVSCHAVGRNAGAGYVQDNNGVRAITQEFTKWSHHVTGVALQDAHCAACHLEGKAVNGKIVVDPTKHAVDAKTHLRNADSDADMQWDPAAPNHSVMDTYCMSCHDANGATSTQSAAIRAIMIPAVGKTASAKNPFGDTISNRYDKMQRPAVTNVDNQFDTTNNSHHGVKGPRYSGNSRFTGVDANGNPRRQIASASTFANNSSALLQGVRSTIYDAGNLNQLYTPLANAAGESFPRTGSKNLGDDSTLHCGDCHTVGQWKVGSSETANGTATQAVIGAHGSNNEYMLRNSIGSDERHTQNAFLQGNITGNVLDPTTGLPIPNGVVVYTNPNGAFLVCYNCHNYNKYGSIFLATGVLGGHAGEYDAQGRCNGIGNTLPFNGYTTGTKTDGTQFASRFMGPISKYSSTVGAPLGEQQPDFGNIYGTQCLNCHNSGIGNAYGGIHGSANNTEWNNGSTLIAPDPSVTGGAYIDGMGNTTKHQRFLPGLGDIMHTPGTLGGFTGGSVVSTAGGTTYTYVTSGISNDTNWEQKHWQQQAGTVINNVTGAVSGQASAGAGCYTLGATTVTGAAIKASDMSSGLEGPSVTGEGGPATEATDVWGGCDDHTAGQGKGNHGFLKKIVRPVTY
jgi:hypothetical protein